MITPNDIRNPSRKSGYDHVGVHSDARRSCRFHARSGHTGAGKKTNYWEGPWRATALEAAQDYCDYINAQSLLTIEDIRNPKRKSGFDHVNDQSTDQRPARPRPFVAQSGGSRANGTKLTWRGPQRTTAEEAAQDYCDYVNGQRGATPATRAKIVRVERAKLRFVKHPRKVRTRTGAVKTGESKPRREKEGPGYVYLLGMLGSPVEAVKIGESKDEGQYRLAGLQTGNPFELYVIDQIKTDKRLALEEELHLKFAKFHHQNPSLVGEWFVKDDSIVKHFKEVKTV